MVTIIKDAFASLYETALGLYNPDYNLIFETLYDKGGYVLLGVSTVLIPLVIWTLSYRLIKYPYAKLWHWIGLLLIISIVVAAASMGIVNNEIYTSGDPLISALGDPESGYKGYADSLPVKYALRNGILSILISFISSLPLKRISKSQTHLPF